MTSIMPLTGSRSCSVITSVRLICLAVGCLLLAGCASTQMRVSYVQPGEYNLRDVSKIAVVDFNSLSSDHSGGAWAADGHTVGLVQRLVGAAFQSQGLYEVVELGVEPDLRAMKSALASRRYDGVMYGRVWWQSLGEQRGSYPAVMRFQEWQNLYHVNTFGQEVLWCQKLTRQRDQLVWPTFRSKTATLMLSLVIYRLDAQGTLRKLSDTFACADADFLVNNGVFLSRFQGDGQRDTSDSKDLTRTAGLFSAAEYSEASKFYWHGTRRTVGIPNETQIKLMLASQLTAFVSRKLVPTEQSFVLEADFSDDRLDALLRTGAYEGARIYALNRLVAGLNRGQVTQVAPLVGYGLSVADGAGSLDVSGYVSDREDYLYALALCEEHAGEWKRAHFTYSFLFAHCPSQRSADGIGRCSAILKASEDLDWNVIGNIQKSMNKANLH